MKSKSTQCGAVLLVSLVMLVVLTLFAVSSMGLSNTNLKVVGNIQWQRTLEANIRQAIETTVSSVTLFTTPATSSRTVNGQTVSISAPVCLNATTAPGYSALGSSPEDTNWDVTATGTDTATGASTTMHQGIKVRLLAGGCT